VASPPRTQQTVAGRKNVGAGGEGTGATLRDAKFHCFNFEIRRDGATAEKLGPFAEMNEERCAIQEECAKYGILIRIQSGSSVSRALFGL
jgi:hypothetical protein